MCLQLAGITLELRVLSWAGSWCWEGFWDRPSLDNFWTQGSAMDMGGDGCFSDHPHAYTGDHFPCCRSFPEGFSLRHSYRSGAQI